MFPYSAETLQRLKEAGWYEGRQVDPEPFVTSLTKRGFEVNEAATRFFVVFDELLFILFLKAKPNDSLPLVDFQFRFATKKPSADYGGLFCSGSPG